MVCSKSEAFSGNNFTVTEIGQFFQDRIENFVGKGENAGYQHFLLFPTMFSKASFLGPSIVSSVQ